MYEVINFYNKVGHPKMTINKLIKSTVSETAMRAFGKKGTSCPADAPGL